MAVTFDALVSVAEEVAVLLEVAVKVVEVTVVEDGGEEDGEYHSYFFSYRN